ncbi:uncharacterized protein LOC141851786 isoform X1 [Brevipalpus obovatus]|uniref:uncharacterized protein LOC141851786 isoform X1 n=1 Tax=Brevipalpus obovatus TaxID=246614 RepID=UPI003D9E1FAE
MTLTLSQQIECRTTRILSKSSDESFQHLLPLAKSDLKSYSSPSTPLIVSTSIKSLSTNKTNDRSSPIHHRLLTKNDYNNSVVCRYTLLDKVDSSFTQLFTQLQANYLMESSLASKCGTIYEGIQAIAGFAHEYNFDGMNANGYWTFLKSCHKLAELMAQKLNSDIEFETIQKLESLVDIYVRMLSHIMAIREITKNQDYDSLVEDENCNDKNSDRPHECSPKKRESFRRALLSSKTVPCSRQQARSLFVPSSKYLIDVKSESLLTQNSLIHLMSSFGAFWMCKSMKYFFEVYMLAVAFFGSIFPFSLKCLWSREHRASMFVRWIQYPSPSYPFEIWNILDYKLVCKFVVPLLFIGRGIRAQTVHIPIQRVFQFTEDGKDVVCNEQKRNNNKNNGNANNNNNNNYDDDNFDNNSGTGSSLRDACEYAEPTIKCRLIHRGDGGSKSGKLLFHCHGGGWLSHSPDSHENYLRQWAADVPDMTILSVDYSLKKAFPVASQEVLDVYLWATSGKPEVAKILGFQPKTIVFAGDSAGANLTLSLAIALTDLKRKYPNETIRMPDSIVSIYGAHLLTPVAGPSRVLGAMDPLLSPGILLTCGGVYGNVCDPNAPSIESANVSLPKWEWCDSIVTNAKKFLLATYSLATSLITPRNQPWFVCEKNSFQRKMQLLDDKMHIPYCSPLLYSHFDLLKDVKMHIIASEFCPLLDESVTLAKLWQGPVEMDLVPDLPHGFLNFTLVSSECQQGSRLCAKRINEVFQECSFPQ